jgi:hypothetical protein
MLAAFKRNYEKSIQDFGCKTLGKRPLGRPWHRWNIIVKQILNKGGHLVLVSIVMNLQSVAYFHVFINQSFNESAKTMKSI